MHEPVLSAERRQDALKQMAGPQGVDVLVIGGGVTGAGIALDAATRGLTTAVVDAQDWAEGTSSRSSKLIHGGLRYLYQLDFPLVVESLRERGLLLTQNAPHLVKAQPLLWPLKIPVVERVYSAAGVGLYDVLAQASHRGSVPLQKHYSKKRSLELSPALNPETLAGSIVYYDGKVDDARLTVTLLRTAAEYGALAASRVQLGKVTVDQAGRVDGADLVDLETGNLLHVKTKMVINATGVWTEDTQELAGVQGGLRVLASKGIHLVVPKEKIDSQVGLFLRTDKSVLFMIPWKRYWIIGTTDTGYHQGLADPVANAADIDYLLTEANKVLASPLTVDDVVGTFAGLRPLLQPGTVGETESTKVSREHTVTQVVPGLTVIAGGKLTTYRQMAQDAVDFALGPAEAKRRPSITKKTPLSGAVGYEALVNQKRTLARDSGLSEEQVEDLLDRYGSDIGRIFAVIKQDPTLADPLPGAPEYLRADVAFAVTGEGALHVRDVLERRVRLAYEKADMGLAALPEVARMMADLLGWEDEQTRREVEHYEKFCEAVFAARNAGDDEAAQRIMDQVTPLVPLWQGG